jgi:hypothetical protein
MSASGCCVTDMELICLSLRAVCTLSYQVYCEVILLVFIHQDIKYAHRTYSNYSRSYTHILIISSTHEHLFCHLHHKFHVLMNCTHKWYVCVKHQVDNTTLVFQVVQNI